MATLWGYRDGYVIRPYRAYCGTLEQFREGDRVRIQIDKQRGGKFNSLYHVMLGKVADAVNRGPASTSIKQLKNWVKLKKGWYDVVELPEPLPTGETTSIEFRSTSFTDMGESEFNQFAIDTCDLIANDLAPWIKSSPEWGEIRQLLQKIMPPTQENN